MTRDKAIGVLNLLKNYYNDKDVSDDIGYVGFDDEDNEAFDMAIKALEAWDNLFKSYEVLAKEITESEDIKNATKRIDDWCIEQLRGIIGDYYADLIIKDVEP